MLFINYYCEDLISTLNYLGNTYLDRALGRPLEWLLFLLKSHIKFLVKKSGVSGVSCLLKCLDSLFDSFISLIFEQDPPNLLGASKSITFDNIGIAFLLDLLPSFIQSELIFFKGLDFSCIDESHGFLP